MWVKKFLARTLPEAMAQVKTELGPNAVILHTNNVKVGGIFGLFGTRMVEVTAAADDAEIRPVTRPESSSAPLRNLSSPPGPPGISERVLPEAPKAPTTSVNGSADLSFPVAQPRPNPGKNPEEPSIAAMRTEMVSMKAMLGMVLDRIPSGGQAAKLDAELLDLHAMLVGAGIQDEVALQLVDRLRALQPEGKLRFSEGRERLRSLILSDFTGVQTPEPSLDRRRLFALVGPTGVGKTTTLAKLAAYYSLVQRLKVVLVTADTYRIAAVEQLRTYSDILGVPLEVVYEPSELSAALARHHHRDLILVDTAGRSPRNAEHMRELHTYLQILNPDVTYLVVSMTSSYRDAARIADNYLPAGANRFIFTKWDEAEAPGLIYNMVRNYRLPISYVTNGQNVPDDIEVANPEKITRAIIGD